MNLNLTGILRRSKACLSLHIEAMMNAVCLSTLVLCGGGPKYGKGRTRLAWLRSMVCGLCCVLRRRGMLINFRDDYLYDCFFSRASKR